MATSPDDQFLLKTALDAASCGLMLAKIPEKAQSQPAHFPLVLVNAKAEEWTRSSLAAEATLRQLLQWVNEPGIDQMVLAVAGNGIPEEAADCRFSAPGGPDWIRLKVRRESDLLVIVIEDISARKGIERQLSRSEKKQRLYDSITQTTPDLVYVFDLNYRFTYANKALLSMWGKSAEDAIGKGLRENGYEEWHALMHEREIDTVAATKQRLRGTVSFPHAELGKRIYDYIFAPVFNEKGEVEFVAGTTRDITDFKNTEENLQQSEARLKSVIDQTPAPTLVLWGDDLVIEQINRPMLELIGQGEEIIGKPLIEVLPELEGQYVWTQLQKVYTEGIAFDQSEVLVPHTRNGVMHDHYYNLAYRPRTEHNKITGMIQVAIDVTEQVVARKIKEESEHRYRLLSESLEQLVSEEPVNCAGRMKTCNSSPTWRVTI